ncbi:hypothetical protein GPECTOR_493g446 [Gonium pectorale]|uniref:COR domain-containing protein n=1 Tax=Gonium pectorale TaxID=33097 RepID=A0A150FUW9_GONPE|nr:hypothetical protein GPECTOR_493g446 [Gonium pectorale]|eukprot:KXZ41397.1 hypothetical protein GPECTOR_493g446 [Gonium pectorale]
MHRSQGFTPLHSACEWGHRDAVVVLLRAGANHTLVSWDGKTPLDVARSRGVKGLVELLRQHAADRSSAVQVAARSSLVLVGPGYAGKTTLAVRLATGEFVEPKVTHGLLVHEWSVPECEGQPPQLFSIWDMGGQDVYLSTHTFFMVREALYVMVYNSRNTDKDSVDEYLNRVTLLMPDKAPLLVATHAWEGDFKAQEPPAPVLKAYGINAEAFICLSSKTGQGIEQLKQAIISTATKTSGPFADCLPEANMKVREEVRRMREDLLSTRRPPLIPLGELEEVAKSFSIAAPQDLRRCMDRLTDMGELRHFSDVPGLEDVVVIDPRWMADLMAKIVTTDASRVRELGLNQGRTSMEALKKAAILQALIKRLEQEESEANSSSCQPGLSPLPEGGGDKPGELDEYVSCQEARSSIEKLLEEGMKKADGGPSQGPLRRVVSRSGAVMWLCRCHAEEHVW